MNRQEYLLTCLIEECSEVQKAATKALRFGLHKAKCPEADRPYDTNEADIQREFADLLAVHYLLESEGHLLRANMAEAIAKKRDKVEKYMKVSKECGTLSDEPVPYKCKVNKISSFMFVEYWLPSLIVLTVILLASFYIACSMKGL